jgi:hypothetical protein
MTEMLRGVLASQASKVAHIIRELPSTVGTLKDAAVVASRTSSLRGRHGKGRRQPDAGAAHAAERVGHRTARLRQRDAAAGAS